VPRYGLLADWLSTVAYDHGGGGGGGDGGRGSKALDIDATQFDSILDSAGDDDAW